MTALFAPGCLLAGRLSLSANLALIVSLLLLAQGLSHYGVAAAALAVFCAGLYFLCAFFGVSRSGQGRLHDAAQRVASGDLSLRTAGAIGQMAERLAGIVAQVRAGAEAILRGSGEVSGGCASLSQRTEEQA